MYGSKLLGDCYIDANGSSEADGVITIDFGQESCTNGISVSLDNENSIFVGDKKIVWFSYYYRDIIFKMTECDDVISILKTRSNMASISILGYGGNDRIVLGDHTQPLDEIIFGSIMVDGGRGDADVLWIHNDISPAGFNAVGAQSISYLATENIDVKVSDNRLDDTTIVVDLGQGPCTSGKTLALRDGDIFIAGQEPLHVGTKYKRFIFEMTDCDDQVSIVKTYTDTSSVEVLGFNGDDRISLGDDSHPFHTLIFANIKVDGGHGSADLLIIHDEASPSSTTKSIEVDSTKISGFYGNQTILYSSININMLVGAADAEVNVNSTAEHTSLELTTQDGNDLITVNEGEPPPLTMNSCVLTLFSCCYIGFIVQGPLKINSGCGDDSISINKTKGGVRLNSRAGIRSSINANVEDTLGDVYVDFGSAKSHTIALSNTQGNILIDSGFRVEQSHILIGDTFGSVDLTVGSGRLHNVSLSNTQGATNLIFDLGDKTINAHNTLGSLTASLGNGDSEVCDLWYPNHS